jgi:ABC-type branched-subunit amino acid transport system ATPase component
LIVDELTQGLQNAISGTLVARILAACMHDDLSIIFTDDNPEIVDALAGRRLNIEDGTCE